MKRKEASTDILSIQKYGESNETRTNHLKHRSNIAPKATNMIKKKSSRTLLASFWLQGGSYDAKGMPKCIQTYGFGWVSQSQNRSTISLKLQHVLRHNYDYTFNDLLMYVGAVLATKSHQTSNMYVFWKSSSRLDASADFEGLGYQQSNNIEQQTRPKCIHMFSSCFGWFVLRYCLDDFLSMSICWILSTPPCDLHAFRTLPETSLVSNSTFHGFLVYFRVLLWSDIGAQNNLKTYRILK